MQVNVGTSNNKGTLEASGRCVAHPLYRTYFSYIPIYIFSYPFAFIHMYWLALVYFFLLK